LTDIEYGDWYYIRLEITKSDGYALVACIKEFFDKDKPDLASLVGENENPAYERYDEYVPQELIRRGYIEDNLQGDEIREWLKGQR
jgi:hypothetical protein